MERLLCTRPQYKCQVDANLIANFRLIKQLEEILDLKRHASNLIMKWKRNNVRKKSLIVKLGYSLLSKYWILFCIVALHYYFFFFSSYDCFLRFHAVHRLKSRAWVLEKNSFSSCFSLEKPRNAQRIGRDRYTCNIKCTRQ